MCFKIYARSFTYGLISLKNAYKYKIIVLRYKETDYPLFLCKRHGNWLANATISKLLPYWVI